MCSHTQHTHTLHARKCYKNNGKKVSRENSTHCYVHKLAIGMAVWAKLRQLNKSMCSSFTPSSVLPFPTTVMYSQCLTQYNNNDDYLMKTYRTSLTHTYILVKFFRINNSKECVNTGIFMKFHRVLYE